MRGKRNNPAELAGTSRGLFFGRQEKGFCSFLRHCAAGIVPHCGTACAEPGVLSIAAVFLDHVGTRWGSATASLGPCQAIETSAHVA